jgi:Right handed beta helix region
MKRSFFVTAGVTVALAATAAAQVITVVGTGDPTVDVPAVQAAVDQGGRVVLKGRLSFDAPPTIAEQPEGALGMILISKTVAISGALDDHGQMTDIEGGTNPFYVEAPGAHVSIKGLHFLHSKVRVIRVVAAGGLVISSNRIEGVASTGGNVDGIQIDTSPGASVPIGDQLEQAGNVAGTLLIANNDIDMQAQTGHNYLGIVVFAAGKSPDREVDLYISGNQITNSNERPINIYSIDGRAYIERNVITTTGGAGVNVMPSGDVIHIAGPGSFLIAHNTINCQWTSGLQAGIRLQTRPGEPVSHAIVVDNDVNMSAPEGTMFGVTSAAIEIRGIGDGNVVLNNRIRGRANFALSVISSTPGSADFTGVPQNTVFIMNDLTDFTSTQADVFVDAGGTNTIVVGSQNTVEDHGVGTVIVPVLRVTSAVR